MIFDDLTSSDSGAFYSPTTTRITAYMVRRPKKRNSLTKFLAYVKASVMTWNSLRKMSW